MTNNSACISILQLSDLHILASPEDKLLGINTEHYFHACLEQAVRLRSRQAVSENPPQPPFFKGGDKESTLSFKKEEGNESTFSFSKEGEGSTPPFEKGGLGGDLILLTGDLAQDPCLASYRRIFNTIEAYKTPCICLPGNHDDYELMQQVFNTDRVSCRKQVFLGNWQVISLNSQIPGKPGGRLSNEELVFLENCLSEKPNYHALIAVHHHCLETKSPWMDSMIIENSQELLAIVDKYLQVKVITNGHIHQVMDVKTSTLRVLGAPSTCFQFTPGSTEFRVNNTAPGYRLVDLYADGRVESEVIRLPGLLDGLQTDNQGY